MRRITLTALVTAALLILSGYSALAQHSAFSISCDDSHSNAYYEFGIWRGSTSKEETVRYRTVGITACPDFHFSERVGSVTFAPNEDRKYVQVSRMYCDGNTEADIIYSYHAGTTRSLRFEVLDEEERTVLASYTLDLDFSAYRYTSNCLSKGDDLVYFTSNGQLASGVPEGKYYDHYYTANGDQWQEVDDGDAYSHFHRMTTAYFVQEFLGITNARVIKYLNYIGHRIYATVYFSMYEKNDGYQYIQIVVDNDNEYDGSDPDGDVNTPVISAYKACFILSYANSGSVISTPHYQFFPHRYDYIDRATEIGAGVSHYEFDSGDSHLYKQAFQNGNWDYRASNAGALSLTPTANHSIVVRFDAAGSGEDDWFWNNMFLRQALVDPTPPTLFSNPRVVPGYYYRNSLTTIYLPFREIMSVSGTPTISTSWGTFTYAGGAGTNVLSFSGTVNAPAGTALSVTGYSGTITDVVGNAFVWPGTITTASTVRAADSIEDFGKDSEGRYLITCKADLYKLAQYCNAGEVPVGASFLQTANIVCDNSYVPVGTSSSPFIGSYDGGGHTISGIVIDSSDGENLGVFGYVQGTSSVVSRIRNVILFSGSIKGRKNVGGIVGTVQDNVSVTNCAVRSNVTIQAGCNSAECLGGIVGLCYPTIGYYKGVTTVEGCISSASVLAGGMSGCKNFGGIAGMLGKYYNTTTASINDCLYTGEQVSGATSNIDPIVGLFRSGTISNSYFTNSSLAGDRLAYRISLGANVVIDGAQTIYNVSELTSLGSSVLKMGSTYYSGKDNTVTLSYTGTVPNGYAVTYKVNGSDITGNTITMPAEDVTISASVALAENLTLSTAEVVLLGETMYVTTYYHGNYDYRMPEGARAYTAAREGTKVVFRLIGDDGSVIPHGTAAIIAGTSPEITITKIESTGVTARSGNILLGSNSALALTDGKLGGRTVYVLGSSDGVVNFYQFNGPEIPAGKAFYLK